MMMFGTFWRRCCLDEMLDLKLVLEWVKSFGAADMS